MGSIRDLATLLSARAGTASSEALINKKLKWIGGSMLVGGLIAAGVISHFAPNVAALTAPAIMIAVHADSDSVGRAKTRR
jgi:hypothetical protein